MATKKLTVDDLTQRNIDAVAAMERASHVQRTVGERVADAFAAGVGSWGFVIAQSLILSAWIIVNIALPAHDRWDPFPFILMNLVLSFQAAYASPIIMMSQNRLSKLAERRHHLDLQINMLAEQESTEILRLLRALCAHHKLVIPDEPKIEGLEQQTEPSKVVKQIEAAEKEVRRQEKAGGKPE